MPELPANQGYQVTLSLANASTTNFAVNLVNAVEADGGTGYLTETNVAAAQVAYNDFSRDTSPGYKFARLTTSRSYTFPDNYFTNNATKHFLFEGAGIGSGQLVLTISQATAQGTNVIAQTGAWLDLRDVRNMYEQVHISGVTNSVPPNTFLSSSYQQLNWADSSSDEDTNIIVFVHGWRMGVWDYYNFSESMFKRLYWQGYRGRFASIRWDTLSKDDFKFASTLQSFTTYNSSEYRAWESAKGVSDYLTSLKQRFPNYNLSVCAHSMGNVVMAEALKLQLAAGQRNVNNYVLMQAAVPASCYDTSFTNYAPMLAAEASQPTPNTYWGHPGAINGAVSGHLVNFFNANDYALATATIYIPLYGNKPVSWEANQMDYKPDSGFNYTTDGTNSWNLGFFPTKLITDSHEIMSFCARPRSKAVGAQSGVAGVIQGGSVDLHANFGFDRGSDQHSAQFNWNIQQLSGFYETFLNALIPPGQ
jgi:pimeloyl-ACP methyl ester carboxylesterase